MTGAQPAADLCVAGRYRLAPHGPGRGQPAHDELLDRPVRLLAVPGLSAGDSVAVREAARTRLRAVERLSNAGVVPVIDVVRAGATWAVVPPAPGCPLPEVPDTGGAALGEHAADDLLRALAALHEQGLPHRELSASACLLTENGALLDVPALGPVTGAPATLMRTDLDRLADIVSDLCPERASRLGHLVELLNDPSVPDAAEVLRRWSGPAQARLPDHPPTAELDMRAISSTMRGVVPDRACPNWEAADGAHGAPRRTAMVGRARAVVESVVLLLISVAAALLLVNLLLE